MSAGPVRPLVFAVATLLAGVAGAQSVKPVVPAYRPGRYVPVQVEAEAAGPVRIAGPGVQAVEWPAAGRGVVVLPLLIYDAIDGLMISVNGRTSQLGLHALGPDDADPPELSAFWQGIDPRRPSGPAADSDAYALAAAWQPDRSDATRRWALGAVVATLATLALARHAWPRHATGTLAAAGVAAAVLIALAFPADVARRVLRAEGQPGWQWVWFAASPGTRVSEAWVPGLRALRDRGGPDDATLHCDASARPVFLSASADANGRVVFVRPRSAAP